MDNERYNEIVTTYSPMVYRIALHDCRNHADAEDVMQNVFLRLYRFAPEFQSEEHLRRWLIQVTVRNPGACLQSPSGNGKHFWKNCIRERTHWYPEVRRI